MTILKTLEEIFACPSVQRFKRASQQSIRDTMRAVGAAVPKAHEELLGQSDGLMGYGGYFRLLGCSDVLQWNEVSVWKFAWPHEVQAYLCFGENAWGDQYTYRYDELRRHASPSVYLLDALSMQAEKIADSFEVFMTQEFLRNCIKPYDDYLVGARNRLGDLAFSEHIAYVPPPLITGSESLDNVVKMNARVAMIANGDLAAQLSDELQSRPIQSIEPYVDTEGRPRLRVVWGDEA
jgi:hypothetical protein